MAAGFGVHIGNTSACLAMYTSGNALVIANDSGDRVTPAVLALNDHEWEIGLPAKSGQFRNKATVTNNKRLLNDDWNDADLNCVESSSTCRIITDERTVKYEFISNDNTVFATPDDIAIKLYAKQFTIASHAVRTESELKAVLAAPLDWSKSTRDRMVKSAELAGFEVLQVISEPAAAVLAYKIGEPVVPETINVLVYRLGGTSCDATIVKVSEGFMSIAATVTSDLGGKCLTRDLSDYLAQEFQQKWKLDPRESRRAMSKLFNHADNCKHCLSSLSSATVFIESLLDGVDWSQNVSRARFENIISPKISVYMEPIQNVINQFNDKIHKIVLCGGSMRIPKLQSAVAGLLPEAELLSGICPDEVIAEGCARQAGLLLDAPDLILSDVSTEVEFLEKDIFLKYLDKAVCIFKAGSPMFSQTSHEIENGKFFGKLDVTLFNDPDEHFAVESFDLEERESPFTLKATLQTHNILLQVE